MPLELWSINKPAVKLMRIFGCKSFYHNNDINTNKFDVRVKSAVSIGYSEDLRAYRLYDLKERRIHENREVISIEEKMAYENVVNKKEMTKFLEYIAGKKKLLEEQARNYSEEYPEEFNEKK